MEEFLDLSKFSKVSYINKGSFAEVYKVKEIETGQVFAAKISQYNLTEDQKSLVTNLKREVGIISRLNHPSILKFIGYSPIDFDNQSKPVIITEYSANGSLANIIQLERQSLSLPMWDDTKKLITLYGIASAMSYLHSHNIIHRDLKPENILEDDFLFPKIADFGLSKIMHINTDSMTTQSTAGFKGTPIYMAPESWDNNEYSKASDVYAFAIISYQILTLEQPFKDYTITMLCRKVAINGERPIFKFKIPDCYQNLITRCWSQEPEKRPTFDQIKEELKNNRDFITDAVDGDQFLDYVEMIDNIDCSFDPNKRFQKIFLSKITEPDSMPSQIDSNNSIPSQINSNNSMSSQINSNNSMSSQINSNNSMSSQINSNNSISSQNNSNEKIKEIVEETEERKRKIELKEVCHHTPHSILGKSSKNHTHYTIYHITRTEQRIVKTDSDGNKEYSEWKVLPETESKQEVGSGMEGGFTQGYERDI